MHKRTEHSLRLLALVVGLDVTARAAVAQAPVVTKAGAEAVTIAFVGRPAPTRAADTTTIFAGREELQRFVAGAQAARAHQRERCTTRDADAPTLGGTGNGWTLRLTCARSAASGAEWRLAYVDATAPSAARTATLGSAAEVDAWLARVDSLVRGARQIRLKPLPRAP